MLPVVEETREERKRNVCLTWCTQFLLRRLQLQLQSSSFQGGHECSGRLTPRTCLLPSPCSALYLDSWAPEELRETGRKKDSRVRTTSLLSLVVIQPILLSPSQSLDKNNNTKEAEGTTPSSEGKWLNDQTSHGKRHCKGSKFLTTQSFEQNNVLSFSCKKK